MPFGVEKREFTTYVEYVYLILGLVGLLVLAVFMMDLDALASIGLDAGDLLITSLFDLLVAVVIRAALDKKDISDFEFFIFLIVIGFLDLILFHNAISALLAILLFVAASGFVTNE